MQIYFQTTVHGTRFQVNLILSIKEAAQFLRMSNTFSILLKLCWLSCNAKTIKGMKTTSAKDDNMNNMLVNGELFEYAKQFLYLGLHWTYHRTSTNSYAL